MDMVYKRLIKNTLEIQLLTQASIDYKLLIMVTAYRSQCLMEAQWTNVWGELVVSLLLVTEIEENTLAI